jgi:hypothetical protein
MYIFFDSARTRTNRPKNQQFIPGLNGQKNGKELVEKFLATERLMR